MVPIIGELLIAGFSLIDDIFTSDEERAREKLKLQHLANDQNLAELQANVTLLQGQHAINAQEAKHKSVFVAGWRPFAGWVVGFSLAYISILEPIMRFIALMAGYTGKFPVIDTSITIQVLLGMLGIAGLRSYDKTNKTQTDII